MNLHNSLSPISRVGLLVGFIATALPITSQAQDFEFIDLVDDFDGAELDLSVWEFTGGQTNTVSGGSVIFSDGNDWASGNISTQQRFLIPPPGETTTITWTLGTGSIITPNPNNNNVIRYQIGIHSANETSPVREHWLNTTGGLWIDLDNLNSDTTGTASGSARFAADNKIFQSNANELGPVSLDWNWLTENRVLSLTLTDTEYSWHDGDTLLFTDSFANAGIDTEFSNGFRVLGLGMNFEGGRGDTSFERVEITNGSVPTGAITNFESDRTRAFSGQEVNLSWLSADGATLSLNQDIGDVTPVTTDGAGNLTLRVPTVTEPTSFDYTLTAVLNGNTTSRTISIDANPTLPLSTDSFFDDFDGDFLNDQMWGTTGDQSFFLADSAIEWGADGTQWSHGEIESLQIYPIPTGGNTTTITWVYGPSTITVDNGDGTAIRPLMGIFSAFEDETFSKQHWQNDEGGIWLDIGQMGLARLDGVSGTIHVANDSKTTLSNAQVLTTVDVPGWNWQTEDQEFSLVLSETGFTWFAGENEIGSGVYSDFDIDSEFEAGFGVMAMAGNYNNGRGEMSFQSVSLDNGAIPFNPEIQITDIGYSTTAQSLTLEWVSQDNAIYNIEELDANGDWQLFLDEVDATGTLTSTTIPGVVPTSGIFRVIEQ